MKGFADYLCEEMRREERNIACDIERELQKFVEQTRREIAETREWLHCVGDFNPPAKCTVYQ